MDRTIQLKKFEDGEDEPNSWLEWRNLDLKTFSSIEQILRKALGEPMDRSGD
jgi:hypothetical protein